MICFSKLLENLGRISSRVDRQNKIIKRCTHTVKFKGVDKENYLNKRTRKNVPEFLAVVTLGVPLTCFALAIWQVDRKRWKDRLVQDMKLRTRIPPIELPEDLSLRRELEYRQIKVRGRFDHSQEMYLGPRSLIINSEFEKKNSFFLPLGSPEKPNLGFYVVTPFKLADRDLTILVNRGWVPNEQKDPETRLEGQIEEEVELVGILRLKEDKPRYVGEAPSNLRIFRYRDLVSMSELANSSFVFLDALEEYSVPGGPIGGQTQVRLKNDHLEYILTWSAIGLYTFYMWHKRFIRKLN